MLKRYFESLKLICGNADARKELSTRLKRMFIQVILCCACLALALVLTNKIAMLINSLLYSYHTTTEALELIAILALCVIGTLVTVILTTSLAVGLRILVYYGVRASLDKLILKQWEEADHGQTMAEVIMRIHNLPVEYCAIFDDDGRKISESTIFSREECYAPATRRFKMMPSYSGVMIHNHPSGDQAFSADDFTASITCGFRKSIVVTPKLIYTLEIPEYVAKETDPEELLEDVEEVFSALFFTPGDVLTMWGSGDVAAWYGACRAIAHQYGMTLTVEKLAQSPYAKEYRQARRQVFFKKVFGFYAEQPNDTQPAEYPEENLVASPKAMKHEKNEKR